MNRQNDRVTHRLRTKLTGNHIKIALVGAGGNGSQMLSGLARMDRALRALGRAQLHVTIWDPDQVSESNVGRQLFSPADVGLHKAIVLTHRLNTFFGIEWTARLDRFPASEDEPWKTDWGGSAGFHNVSAPDLLITCVDTARARREIHRAIWRGGYRTPDYWLDLGNMQHTGQIILGCPPQSGTDAPETAQVVEARGADFADGLDAMRKNARPLDKAPRLRCVTEIYPEILDPDYEEDDHPSCSMAEALAKQDLFVNQTTATLALNLLWRLLRRGEIDHHGYVFDLDDFACNPFRLRIGATDAPK